MTVGPGTYPSAVLAAAGAVPVGAVDDEPYPLLDLEAAAAAEPELVLLPDEPFDFHHTGAGELIAALQAASGARTVPVREVFGHLAAWYGCRSGQRLAALASVFHPDLPPPRSMPVAPSNLHGYPRRAF